MESMVVGYVFLDNKNVYLIRKKRPAWQNGLLNGIGGHIEKNESPIEAMIRECKEEAKAEIEDWVEICKMSGEDWELTVFAAYLPDLQTIVSQTDEEVGLYSINSLSSEFVLANVRFLVPMCIEHMLNPHTFRAAHFVY